MVVTTKTEWKGKDLALWQQLKNKHINGLESKQTQYWLKSQLLPCCVGWLDQHLTVRDGGTAGWNWGPWEFSVHGPATMLQGTKRVLSDSHSWTAGEG